MLLSDILVATPVVRTTGVLDRPVSSVTRDTREVRQDGVFVAIRGETVDGHDLVDRVPHAAAVVVERPVDAPAGVTVLQVEDTRHALASLAAAIHGFPGRSVRVVGVTGTNGKTTVTTLVEEALRAIGVRAGRIGTTGAVLDGQPRPVALTTPEAPAIQETLAAARDRGVGVVALEASSIGLDQHRIAAIPFHTAVFTNLTRDHLDYHGDLARYAAAKRRLFTELLRREGGWPRAILCGDDPAWADMHPPPDRWLYGLSGGDIHVTRAEVTAQGMHLDMVTPVGTVEVSSPLVGRHNAQNLAAALAILLTLDVPLADAARGLSHVRGVPGRFEVVPNPGGALLLVDYAHTPDALDNALRAARGVCAGRLFVVFGCGGDRDRGKRAEMGAVAASLADVVVVTSDNPRSEDPEAILDDVVAGLSEPPACREVDRRAAIRWAVDRAAPGDVVLVAGKGHETYQEIRGERLPFDDREVLRRAVEER